MAGISWSTVVVLNICLMLATAAFGDEIQCASNVPGWACGQAFEPLIAQFANGITVLSAFTAIAGFIETVLALLLFYEYDILFQDNFIMGSVGFVILVIGIVATLVGMVSVVASIIRR